MNPMAMIGLILTVANRFRKPYHVEPKRILPHINSFLVKVLPM
jgi:hypothetical protein